MPSPASSQRISAAAAPMTKSSGPLSRRSKFLPAQNSMISAITESAQSQPMVPAP